MRKKKYKVCCPCGAKLISNASVSLEFRKKEGWELIGEQWYCDDCAPYKRKAA